MSKCGDIVDTNGVKGYVAWPADNSEYVICMNGKREKRSECSLIPTPSFSEYVHKSELHQYWDYTYQAKLDLCRECGKWVDGCRKTCDKYQDMLKDCASKREADRKKYAR